MVDPTCDKNVFQLWKENGEKLPFKVIRWTWSSDSAFLVERIAIRKWPYGMAWGRFIRNGLTDTEAEELSCAGSYQWKIVP
jgi:hypothetical protein